MVYVNNRAHKIAKQNHEHKTAKHKTATASK